MQQYKNSLEKNKKRILNLILKKIKSGRLNLPKINNFIFDV